MNTADDFTTPQDKPTAVQITPDTATPRITEAIEHIESYKFAPPNTAQETETTAAIMMTETRENGSRPRLHTDKWAYNGKRPNPISISKARKMLATAYAAIPCELDGTDIHGYAWMIETATEWKRRGEVEEIIVPPKKPTRSNDGDLPGLYRYKADMNEFKLYSHLVQEGKAKLIEWFGESMFVDLYIDEMLPTKITPRELLEHLTATYAKSADNRRYMAQVDTSFRSNYDHKQPVEAYFMKLQTAQNNATLLGRRYTEEQLIDQALAQFESYLGGKDAAKSEKRWLEKEGDHTWTAFKQFWKDEIHQWETVNKSQQRHANQAIMEDLTVQMDSMKASINALQAENQTVRERNNDLVTQQISFQQALNAEYQRRGNDDMSVLTNDYASAYERGLRVGLNANSSSSGNSGSGTNPNAPGSTQGPPRTQELLHIAKNRAPDAYKHYNNGQGKRFSRYCWRCGCNCTHSTRGCYECTDDEKRRYKDATFTNTMGGSTKFLERRDQYQKDFNYDSL